MVNPVSTLNKRYKLFRSRPDPTSKIAEIATSATTRDEPTFFHEVTADCWPPSFNALLRGAERPSAGGNENSNAASKPSPAAKSRVRGSTEASLRYGML